MRIENKLDKEKAENIANELLKSGISSFGASRSLYGRIQALASKLDYIEHLNGFEATNKIIISENDYMMVSDKIWEFITKGYLAPGLNSSNPGFPHVHLTEKGKRYCEQLNQEKE